MEEDPTTDVSRTQRKRQALDLQKLGERLVGLDPGDLAKVPVPEDVEDAIAVLARIKSHEARRRQLQFIGKLMRRIDTEAIREALDEIDGESAEARYQFHQLESWRDRLIDDPDALTEYLSLHPRADRQRLRQQLTRIRKAGTDDALKSEGRNLFRLLREFAETGD
jgi:ribosome-associated protein